MVKGRTGVELMKENLENDVGERMQIPFLEDVIGWIRGFATCFIENKMFDLCI